eukprot:c25273_g2_i4 orf=128-1849(+)
MTRTLQEAVQTLCVKGHLDRAFDALSHLHTHPSTPTYLSLFTACSKIKALTHTRLLHSHLLLLGTPLSPLLGQHLVVALAKCGAVDDALHVSCALSHRTVFSWTAIISGFSSSGHGLEALKMHQYMLEDGVEPDHYTFVSLFKACGDIPDLTQGRTLHADARQRGFAEDNFVASTLIGMYSKCGAIFEAENVFNALTEHDAVTWNSMLSACVEHDLGEKALLLYRQMQEEGVTPNQRTFVVVLQACAILAEKEEFISVNGLPTKVMALRIGQALHTDAGRIGLTYDVFVGNTLIGMYGKCGAIVEAEEVFGALVLRDIVSWNAMVSAYVDHGQEEKALRLYGWMQKHLVTHVTLTRILQACSATGSLNYCKQLHFEVVSAGYDQNSSIAATLISAYGGCSSMLDSLSVFHGVSEPDLTTWNACIAGHAGDGDFSLSFYRFENMRLAGMIADGVTFLKIISACARTALVVEGLEYFESMCFDYGICPDMKHYGCVLDLLGRTGDFKRIECFLEGIPMQVDVTFWLGLLGACTRGNLELAERAFRNAVNLQPKQSTAYVLMSNIYADAGLQECAA